MHGSPYCLLPPASCFLLPASCFLLPGLSTMEHILITGGAGFIGSHLVDYLMSEAARAAFGLRAAPRVTVVDNFDDFYDPAVKRANVEPHLERDNFELIVADVTDVPAMHEL